jgi:hypothetical protein
MSRIGSYRWAGATTITLRNAPICVKMFHLLFLLVSSGNSNTICTQLDMCVYTPVLHNTGKLVGQKKYKILEQQWMPRAKEIFPCAILGTHAVGWSALD